MIETIATVDVIELAWGKLKNIDYNDKEKTENSVVEAKVVLQEFRDKLQNEIDQFDEWAKTQSDTHTQLELDMEGK